MLLFPFNRWGSRCNYYPIFFRCGIYIVQYTIHCEYITSVWGLSEYWWTQVSNWDLLIADLVPLIEQSPTPCFLESETLSSRVGLGSDDLPPAIQEIANKESRGKVHRAVLWRKGQTPSSCSTWRDFGLLTMFASSFLGLSSNFFFFLLYLKKLWGIAFIHFLKIVHFLESIASCVSQMAFGCRGSLTTAHFSLEKR